MRQFPKWVIVLMSCLLIMSVISACTSNNTSSEKNGEQDQQADTNDNNNEEPTNETEDQNKAETASLDAPEPPQNAEQLFAYPMGAFAGATYDEQQQEIEEALDQLPKLQEETDEATVNVYWAKLLSMFAEDYPDPEKIVKQLGVASFGDPEIEDPRLQFKDSYNVEILLDASGSMAAQIGGKTMMEIAKDAIKEFSESLPEGANVALRVYGHKGSNANSDKKVSCDSSELVYDLQPYDGKSLQKAMDKFGPTGWTPLARSIEAAQKDLSKYDGEHNTNIIYIVSDGVETCGGDPVKAAKSLADSNITPIVNVIGFDVDSDGQKQLKEVAKAADGTYANAQNQDELTKEFDRAKEIAEKWEEWKLESINKSRDIRGEQRKMVHENDGIWKEKRMLEENNLQKAIDYLQSINNDKALSELYSLSSERTAFIEDVRLQVFDDLYEISEKNYDEMWNSIQEKYGKNVDK